jgi:hypothetical protein
MAKAFVHFIHSNHRPFQRNPYGKRDGVSYGSLKFGMTHVLWAENFHVNIKIINIFAKIFTS